MLETGALPAPLLADIAGNRAQMYAAAQAERTRWEAKSELTRLSSGLERCKKKNSLSLPALPTARFLPTASRRWWMQQLRRRPRHWLLCRRSKVRLNA